MSEKREATAGRIGQETGNRQSNIDPANSDAPQAGGRLNDQRPEPASQMTLAPEADQRIEASGPPGSSEHTSQGDPTARRAGDPADFPKPPAASDQDVFKWDESDPLAETYARFGKLLASKEDFYRRSAHGGGLLLAPAHSNAPPVALDDTTRFQAALLDYVRVTVSKDGKPKGGLIPTSHLRAMSRSELFLRELPAVDEVVDRVIYLPPDFRPTVPGYNNRGFGQRVLHVGPPVRVARSPEALDRFLDIMAFESPADRTHAYAAGLTVLLRNFWPGGKPIVVVTANKSHSGKETLISCFAGLTPMISVSYQPTNWAFERSFVGALRQDPRVGVINIDNARLEGARFIRSAFLERFLTDPQPFLFSTGSGRPVRLWNNVVVTMSTNEGSLSPDLMNRNLPIRLAPRGDVTRRASPIGNPKHEYLPRHREQIEAEFHGMIANWHDAGRPLATDVIHPYGPWAQTIGGILRANGIEHFLENLDTRHNVDDLVRRSLGLLGAASPDDWRTASEWSGSVVDLGLMKALIPEADRDGQIARARGTGVTLSAHIDETFEVTNDDNVYKFKLEKKRSRFPGDKEEPRTKYRFKVLASNDVPLDTGRED